ncbi:hypothetical protein [Nocardia jiangsuensis]|uniref:SWIM-type domain-containing protein n=1 Tax=Nocardia jiangsuensis TaxID=1691563 RepID=A0ABV8DQ60_9NOCA
MPENEFGYTRWGMDWVRLAEPLRSTRPEPLLPRARSIARNSGVRTVVDGRLVRATIQRGGQASVTHLEVAPPARAAVAAVAGLVPDPALLGDDAHAALRAAGIDPAPVLAATDCSCSARRERCVHLLALCYEVARQVDAEPALALRIGGFLDPAAGAPDTPAAPRRWIPLDDMDAAGWFDTPP